MKKYKEWLKTDKSLREFVEVGDAVDEAMVDYSLNVLPPRNYSHGYLQVGEPIGSCQDADGKWKETYVTFEKEGGTWYYRGCCFAGGTEHKTGSDPWRAKK